VGYNTYSYYGVEVFSTLDLYNLAWQAGLICTLVGSNTIDAKTSISEAKTAVANLFARSNFALQTAA